jgi:hypothetical protein
MFYLYSKETDSNSPKASYRISLSLEFGYATDIHNTSTSIFRSYQDLTYNEKLRFATAYEIDLKNDILPAALLHNYKQPEWYHSPSFEVLHPKKCRLSQKYSLQNYVIEIICFVTINLFAQ